MVALVRRFGLYGRYRSSTATAVSAASICFRSAGVIFSCSSMDAITVAFRSSKFRRYFSRSSNARSCSSFIPPVTSFRYREMNGIVFPSSINLITASVCAGRISNS